MLNPINPYIAGNPVGGEECFVGRADVLRDVRKVLENPKENAIVLYGQRRIGKTSILQELDDQLSKEDRYVPISFDLQDKAAWSLGEVLADLAREISYRLKLSEPNNLDFNQNNTFREVLLQRVLETLPNSCSLVLLFDEFDVLDNPSPNQAGKDFFPYLRDLMSMDRERLKFIFVIGRKPEDLDVLTLSVFKGVKAKRVSLLNKENTERLILLSQQNETLHWEKEAIDEIYNLANGHPFLTQQLCATIWNNAYDKHDEDVESYPTITKENVLDAIPDTLEASVNSLEWVWQGLASAERYVVSVLAEVNSKPINQRELEELLVEKGVRIVIHQLQSAPQILQEWDIIEPVENGYKFRVELLRSWICQKKPVTIVQKELDHIEPQAENIYKVGYDCYQRGQLDDAVNDLQRALGINPNHLQATLLLSRIFLEQQKLEDAIGLLEELYDYNPSAARPLLVQSLLEKAKLEKAKIQEPVSQTDEDKILEIYDRILTFIPNQPEALEKRKLIWEKRGESAYSQERYQEALEAFQKANSKEKIRETEQKIKEQDRKECLRQIRILQNQKEYNRALKMLDQIDIESFEKVENVMALRVDLEQKAKLDELHKAAVNCLNKDEKEYAKKILEEIVSIDSEFENTLFLLLKIKTGMDIEYSMQELRDTNQYLELIREQESKEMTEQKIKLDKKVKEKDEKIQELNTTVKEKDKKIQELNTTVKEKDAKIKELNTTVKEKDAKTKGLDKAIKELSPIVKEKDAKIKELESRLKPFEISVGLFWILVLLCFIIILIWSLGWIVRKLIQIIMQYPQTFLITIITSVIFYVIITAIFRKIKQ